MLRIPLHILQGDGELHPGRGVLRHGKHDEEHEGERGEEHGGGRGGERTLSCIQHSQPCCSRNPACGSGRGQCVHIQKPGEDGGHGGHGGLAGIGHIHRQFQTRARTLWRSRGGCRPRRGFS